MNRKLNISITRIENQYMHSNVLTEFNNYILGVSSCKPNSMISQIPREDKGKGMFHEAPKMT